MTVIASAIHDTSSRVVPAQAGTRLRISWARQDREKMHQSKQNGEPFGPPFCFDGLPGQARQ